MPQEHYVLRCISCETVQAHIVKKSKKWECKICGIKQSLKRNYGKGSGKECRAQVMKLNELRLTQEEFVGEDMTDYQQKSEENYSELSNEPHLTEFKINSKDCSTINNLDHNKPCKSKWDAFLDKVEESHKEEELDNNFTWEVSSKKRKRRENEEIPLKKKIQSDFEVNNVNNTTRPNKNEFNHNENSKEKNSFQRISKWGKYDIKDDAKSGELSGYTNDNLDEILKL